MLMMHQVLTAEQRLQKNVTAIMGNTRYIALAGTLMIGDKGIKDAANMPHLAYTNGRDEYYQREFVATLSDAQLRFVMLHETYHKLFRHLTTWAWMWEEDAQCANYACDYVINLMITDENPDGFAVMPVDEDGELVGLLDRRFINMDAAQVYCLLRKEKQQREQDRKDGKPGSGESGSGSGKPGKGEPQLDHHDWEGAKEMTTEEKSALAREIDMAIRQGTLSAGKIGTGGTRSFGELLQPEVDWRAALRDFITETCRGADDTTWRTPHRRYMAMGILKPSTTSEQMDELVICPDMSMSISPAVLTKFMAEVKSVCDTVKPRAVRILYWDTQVTRDEVYGEGHTPLCDMIKTTKPAGGGGTLVSCVSQYLQDRAIKPQVVLVLTDGELGDDWGTWTAPLMWCVVNNKRAKPPVGKCIHITN